jgi:hypothetical protein
MRENKLSLERSAFICYTSRTEVDGKNGHAFITLVWSLRRFILSVSHMREGRAWGVQFCSNECPIQSEPFMWF